MDILDKHKKTIDIIRIQKLCSADALRWTHHILACFLQRNISTSDIVAALMTGEIIENIPMTTLILVV